MKARNSGQASSAVDRRFRGLVRRCFWLSSASRFRIDAGWVDAFRALHPEAPDQYTWWRQWGGARERNIGWRIDYVFASPAAMRRIHEAFLWHDERGSDHCPVGVDIDL